MEVWYFDYLDNFPSVLFTSSASLSPLSGMTNNSVLYLFLRECIKELPSKKKKKVSAVAFLCVSTVFCPQSETGLRQLALNNWQAS